MAHLIDKDVLSAEIEKIIADETESIKSFEHSKNVSEVQRSNARMGVLMHIRSLLDILEVKEVQKEPASEPNKELAETYLDVFDKKFPILPTLKGKELADYKNFLNKCQQIFELKHWGIYPTQAKLFEKLSLLWATWGAEYLHELGKYNKEEQDTTVSEDLEKAAVEAFKHIVDSDKNSFLEIFKAGAEWKEEQMMAKAVDGRL